ncbi:putative UDP-glucose flavonoid 3-o-glucosyltransferase 3 [Phtheirospermum japonicum]|uniref:Glycosyltransferase n=1 Tax=Phtheirospermum japonicum TaxID=374723 RepID=A0A830C3P7_9LAMI|nr:putative UDP-glucose flavonoid 3-o-glucosyltransferase 3 [Phtheirospermum japonicum]
MKKAELVFIPSPGLSHLISTVEAAKLLLDRDDRLSITVLIMKLHSDQTVDKYTQNIISSSNPNTMSHLRFVNLPRPDETSLSNTLPFEQIDSQATHIREIVSNLIKQPSSPNCQLAGLVLDMFCMKFVEIADEFSLPSYVFFTSGACALGLIFHLISLKFEQNQELTKYKNSDDELSVPCLSVPIPAKALPALFVEESPVTTKFLSYFKRFVETKGIMVNTFYELESFAIQSLLSDEKSPKVYPVGPILNLSDDNKNKSSADNIKTWLDEQPERSVIFLCFGTMGSFEPAQVKEIALALENSGKRFLWSLRKPVEKGTDFAEVLPEGFFERTKGVGRVTGWAAQVAVLAHPAVGGFVSHCGWNSTLESVWFGVPVATFPLYAEQQINAFELVKELGMAEEIRIDYHRDLKGEGPPEIVGAGEIEGAIRRLMGKESRVRGKVKEMQRKSRMALMGGGSSYNAQISFIEDVIRNISL